MQWFQTEIQLPAYKRGFHIITHQILEAIPEISNINVGQMQVFIKHTSASLTLNENADPTVRDDFESHYNRKRIPRRFASGFPLKLRCAEFIEVSFPRKRESYGSRRSKLLQAHL